MISGKYKVYLDGKLVAEKDNSLTIAGRSILMKSIMGVVPTIGGSIQMGISNSANQSPNSDGLISDTRLGFAVLESPVILSYLDNAGAYDAMVFRTTIPAGGTSEAYKIYELGLFPSQSELTTYRDIAMFSGTVNDQWKKTDGSIIPSTYLSTASSILSLADAAAAGYSFRVGDTALFLKYGSGNKIKGIPKTSFATFDSNDKISIAYSKVSGSSPTLSVTFTLSTGGYFTKTGIVLPNTYGVVDLLQSDFTAVNATATQWGLVQDVTLEASVANVVIDAIRINENDAPDVTNGMVSRAVLTSPIQKLSAQQLDIEYYLSIGFNQQVVVS